MPRRSCATNEHSAKPPEQYDPLEPQRPLEAPPYLVPHSSESIRILYADQSLLIVDKPHLLLSVPGRHPLNRDSLISRLQRQFPGVAAAHRLDLDTSGLLVVPRNNSPRPSESTVPRTQYSKNLSSTVHGTVAEEEGEISLPSPPTGKIDRSRRSVTLGKTVTNQIQGAGKGSRPNVGGVTAHHRPLAPATRPHDGLGHPILGCDMYAHPEALAAAPGCCTPATWLQHPKPVTGCGHIPQRRSGYPASRRAPG